MVPGHSDCWQNSVSLYCKTFFPWVGFTEDIPSFWKPPTFLGLWFSSPMFKVSKGEQVVCLFQISLTQDLAFFFPFKKLM